jgi:hypothetical protein
MTATFQIKRNELDQNLLEKLRSLFKDDEIRVIITDSGDDSDYPYNNPAQVKFLLEAIEKINKREGLIQMDLADLK